MLIGLFLARTAHSYINEKINAENTEKTILPSPSESGDVLGNADPNNPGRGNFPDSTKNGQYISGDTPSTYLAKGGRAYSKQEVVELIEKYSALFNYDVESAKRIAYCESGFQWNAKNKNSTASGVFQYIAGTWRGTDEGKAGLSPFDADANIRAALKYLGSRQSAVPWAASLSCHGVR